MSESHPLVDLARRTIEVFMQEGKRSDPPKKLTLEMEQRAGVFVTIHRRGQLRGCIGTIQPRQANVAQEIIDNAISSASRDPRFPPIRRDELADLDIKVDVLLEPEPVDDESGLDPNRYGLIVESKRNPFKRGLLLPNLDGIDTVEKQVYWTRYHKAGITDPDEPVRMYRFEVKRYT